ncbi:formylglycine-generating enzyme family protein [Ferrovibrio terrae]|uniref:formylglycine-generating enzyme family protein n=1 Tax=Ferrovibrio terrae TaxID=2594003 RepID=UPI0031380D62
MNSSERVPLRERETATPTRVDRPRLKLKWLAAAAVAVIAVISLGLWSAYTPAGFKPAAPTGFRDCPDCPLMVAMPAGVFDRGSPKSEQPRRTNENPVITVRIFKPYAIGAFEITRADWAIYAKDTGYAAATTCVLHHGSQQAYPAGDAWRNPGIQQTEQDPVVCVSWQEARAYADWLSKRTGQVYRLPTESEWEYAARAGTKSPYGWGDALGTNRANCRGCGSRWDNVSTAPVGSFPPNRAGLHDMAGNVWEMVEDCYLENLYTAPVYGNAARVTGCQNATLRGGSWDVEPLFVRSAARAAIPMTARMSYVGFRLVREIDPADSAIVIPQWRNS